MHGPARAKFGDRSCDPVRQNGRVVRIIGGVVLVRARDAVRRPVDLFLMVAVCLPFGHVGEGLRHRGRRRAMVRRDSARCQYDRHHHHGREGRAKHRAEESGLRVAGDTRVEAGRAPVIELASQMLVVALGLFLLWKALRPHAHRASGSGPVLAMAAGLVPWTLATMSAVAVLLLGLVPIVGRSL